jgi:hypothetical protein
VFVPDPLGAYPRDLGRLLPQGFPSGRFNLKLQRRGEPDRSQ